MKMMIPVLFLFAVELLQFIHSQMKVGGQQKINSAAPNSQRDYHNRQIASPELIMEQRSDGVPPQQFQTDQKARRSSFRSPLFDAKSASKSSQHARPSIRQSTTKPQAKGSSTNKNNGGNKIASTPDKGSNQYSKMRSPNNEEYEGMARSLYQPDSPSLSVSQLMTSSHQAQFGTIKPASSQQRHLRELPPEYIAGPFSCEPFTDKQLQETISFKEGGPNAAPGTGARHTMMQSLEPGAPLITESATDEFSQSDFVAGQTKNESPDQAFNYFQKKVVAQNSQKKDMYAPNEDSDRYMRDREDAEGDGGTDTLRHSPQFGQSHQEALDGVHDARRQRQAALIGSGDALQLERVPHSAHGLPSGAAEGEPVKNSENSQQRRKSPTPAALAAHMFTSSPLTFPDKRATLPADSRSMSGAQMPQPESQRMASSSDQPGRSSQSAAASRSNAEQYIRQNYGYDISGLDEIERELHGHPLDEHANIADQAYTEESRRYPAASGDQTYEENEAEDGRGVDQSQYERSDIVFEEIKITDTFSRRTSSLRQHGLAVAATVYDVTERNLDKEDDLIEVILSEGAEPAPRDIENEQVKDTSELSAESHHLPPQAYGSAHGVQKQENGQVRPHSFVGASNLGAGLLDKNKEDRLRTTNQRVLGGQQDRGSDQTQQSHLTDPRVANPEKGSHVDLIAASERRELEEQQDVIYELSHKNSRLELYEDIRRLRQQWKQRSQTGYDPNIRSNLIAAQEGARAHGEGGGQNALRFDTQEELPQGRQQTVQDDQDSEQMDGVRAAGERGEGRGKGPLFLEFKNLQASDNESSIVHFNALQNGIGSGERFVRDRIESSVQHDFFINSKSRSRTLSGDEGPYLGARIKGMSREASPEPPQRVELGTKQSQTPLHSMGQQSGEKLAPAQFYQAPPHVAAMRAAIGSPIVVNNASRQESQSSVIKPNAASKSMAIAKAPALEDSTLPNPRRSRQRDVTQSLQNTQIEYNVLSADARPLNQSKVEPMLTSLSQLQSPINSPGYQRLHDLSQRRTASFRAGASKKKPRRSSVSDPKLQAVRITLQTREPRRESQQELKDGTAQPPHETRAISQVSNSNTSLMARSGRFGLPESNSVFQPGRSYDSASAARGTAGPRSFVKDRAGAHSFSQLHAKTTKMAAQVVKLNETIPVTVRQTPRNATASAGNNYSMLANKMRGVRDLKLVDVEDEWHGEETRDALERAARDMVDSTQDNNLFFLSPSSAQLYSNSVSKYTPKKQGGVAGQNGNNRKSLRGSIFSASSPKRNQTPQGLQYMAPMHQISETKSAKKGKFNVMSKSQLKSRPNESGLSAARAAVDASASWTSAKKKQASAFASRSDLNKSKTPKGGDGARPWQGANKKNDSPERNIKKELQTTQKKGRAAARTGLPGGAISQSEVKTSMQRINKPRSGQLASAKHGKPTLFQQQSLNPQSTSINIDLTAPQQSIMEKSISDNSPMTVADANLNVIFAKSASHAVGFSAQRAFDRVGGLDAPYADQTAMSAAYPQSAFHNVERESSESIGPPRQGSDLRYEIADEAETSAPNHFDGPQVVDSMSYQQRMFDTSSPAGLSVNRTGPRSTVGMASKPIQNYIPMKFAKKSVLSGSGTAYNNISDTVSNPFQRAAPEAVGHVEDLIFVESCQDITGAANGHAVRSSIIPETDRDLLSPSTNNEKMRTPEAFSRVGAMPQAGTPKVVSIRDQALTSDKKHSKYSVDLSRTAAAKSAFGIGSAGAKVTSPKSNKMIQGKVGMSAAKPTTRTGPMKAAEAVRVSAPNYSDMRYATASKKETTYTNLGNARRGSRKPPGTEAKQRTRPGLK